MVFFFLVSENLTLTLNLSPNWASVNAVPALEAELSSSGNGSCSEDFKRSH